MIKNVIFDVGNVFVRWSPPEIVEKSSPWRSGVASYRSRQPTPPVSGFLVVAIGREV